MEVTADIDALRRQGTLLAAATDAADPDAAVPTCPDWTVRDLVRHMGGIHRWATGIVADRRTEPWRVGLDEVVGTWPEDADLADWLRAGCAMLADALAAAPDDLECWTFLPAPSPRAMWARRQAHETAIHRIDAELSVGAAPAPFGPDFAADGVDELLAGFVPNRSKSAARRAARPPVGALHRRRRGLGAPDRRRRGHDGCRFRARPRTQRVRSATVRAAAADLYLALWNRAGTEPLAVDGDHAVFDLFLDTVHVR